MNLSFLSPHTTIKKMAFLGAILALLGFCWYRYDAVWHSRITTARETFKPYYLKSYAAAISFSVRNRNAAAKYIPLPMEGDAFAPAKGVPVLLYHSILNDDKGSIEEGEGHNVGIDFFIDQMFSLKQAGWQTVTIEDFTQFIRGQKQLPARSFLLTFDDGRKDSYYPSDPILKALGYNAVMYTIVDRMDTNSQYHLSRKELASMNESGRWEIQSHGDHDHDLQTIGPEGEKGHFMSNLRWLEDEKRFETPEEFDSRIIRDLADSKKELETVFGTSMISYAFPFSDFGQGSTNAAHLDKRVLAATAAVYPLAFYQIWIGGDYIYNYPSDALMMRRLSVSPDLSGPDLVAILERSAPKTLSEGTTSWLANAGWVSGWGMLETAADGSMRFGADESKTGGMAFLDGSYPWTDYLLHAKLDWRKGYSVQLMARYKNEEQYVLCSYTENLVQIQQMLNGERRVIKGVEHLRGFVAPVRDFSAGIRVSGRTVACYLDDTVVVATEFLAPEIEHGGIGFKSWDPQIHNSETVIKDITVEKL